MSWTRRPDEGCAASWVMRNNSSNLTDPKRSPTPRVLPRGVCVMHAQAKDWKRAVDRLWAGATLDLRAAAQLAAEMARSEDVALREPAAQALPSLRAAMLKGAERRTHDIARRRF